MIIDRRTGENVYGHQRRVRWARERIRTGDRVVEFGCGTGVGLTIPLALDGVEIVGVDIDAPSIEFGRRVAQQRGVEADRLQAIDFSDLDGSVDVVIASEVLEHLNDADLDAVLELVHRRLRRGGSLLVTVPNGYGLFELESFIWFRLRLGALLARSGIESRWWAVKRKLGLDFDDDTPSTLSASPHVQRFTSRSIRRRLERAGFTVRSVTGTTVVAGPLTHTAFDGFRCVLKANAWLGSRFTPVAAGFLVDARKP